MPIYEYECSACRYYYDVLQKMSDPVLRKCPSCGKSTLKRLVSAPQFRLKGGGWYETDFKSDQENKRNLADRPEADKPKDEAKPADKTETASKPAESKESASGTGKAKAPPGKVKPARAAKPAARAKSKTPAKGSKARRR